MYNPTTSTFYLNDSNVGGFASAVFVYGPANAGWVPIVGDWDGNGTDTIGLYNPTTSTFYLKDSNSSGSADTTFAYGPANSGWTPVVGDWTDSGTATIGLYNPTSSTFYLKNSNSSGSADTTFAYGPANAGWKPLVGDWNGTGTATDRLVQPDLLDVLPEEQQQFGICRYHVRLWSGQRRVATAGRELDEPGAGGNGGRPGDCFPGRVDLGESDLQPIVNEAIALWSNAGVDAATVQKMRQAQFVISDLPGGYLGETEGNVIYLDTNAAGNGWFVDPTPALNEEFTSSGSGQQLQAVDPRALDRIDLLTVVEHELGHVAGLSDDALAGDIMNGVLGTGARRIASHVDAVLGILITYPRRWPGKRIVAR